MDRKAKQTFRDQYDITETLLQGQFNQMCKCRHKTNKREYVVNIFDVNEMDRGEIEKLQNEVKICSKLHHVNVACLAAYLPEGNIRHLVFEFMPGGDFLRDIANKGDYSVVDIKPYYYQILDGIRYCHHRNIIHRDINPNNLCFAHTGGQTVVKITGFVFAVEAQGLDGDYIGNIGTFGYRAPEYIHHDKYGKPVDLWGCGIILYILLIGRHPFVTNDYKFDNKLFPRNEIRDDLDIDAMDLMKRLIHKNPYSRATVAEAMEHPFLNGGLNPSHLLYRRRALENLKVFNARRCLDHACKALAYTTKRMTREGFDIQFAP